MRTLGSLLMTSMSLRKKKAKAKAFCCFTQIIFILYNYKEK